MPSPFRSGYYPILDEDTDVITSVAARSSDSIRPFPIHPSLLNPTILLLGLLDPNKSYSIKEDYLCVSRYSSNTARTAVAHEVTVVLLMGIPLKDNSL